MSGFFEKFRAFILAAVVHVLIGGLLIVGFDHSTPIAKPMARERVEIVRGSIVDASALQKQIDKKEQKEREKHQAKVDRQKKLEDASRKAKEAKKKAELEVKKLAERKVADKKRLADLAIKRKLEEEAKSKAEAAKKKAELEVKKLAEQKVIKEKRLVEIEVKRKAEEAAKQKAEETRKKAEIEAAQKKAAEEQRKTEEVRKKAAAEAKRKADEAAQKQRNAEEQRLLDQLLESEGVGLENENQSQLQILQQRYENDIIQKVQSSWFRPANFQVGWECKVLVRQGPGGVVLSAAVIDSECDGDEQFRNSVESAVYRADPLPPPEDLSLFARELKLTFRPEN